MTLISGYIIKKGNESFYKRVLKPIHLFSIHWPNDIEEKFIENEIEVYSRTVRSKKLKDKKVKFWRCCGGALFLSLSFIITVGFATSSVFHVQMDGFSPYYVPKVIEVPAGTSVMWENPTSTHHTITHDGCRDGDLCAFDSGSIAPNGKFGLYGLPPGFYPYHCTLHPIMRGTLVVAGISKL